MSPEEYLRQALHLFINDPPDSDFQRGYMEGLKVFANEAMGFKWNDPLLWGEQPPAEPVRQRPALTLINGGRAAEILSEEQR